MITEKIILNNPARFEKEHVIDKNKLTAAAEKACEKLMRKSKEYGYGFPGTCTKNFKYEISDVVNWETGMFTGCFWLAYELTGDKYFKDVALSHMAAYQKCYDEKEGIDTHDVGFIYSPSCVAAYKLTGDDKFRKLALDVADYYYDKSYSKEGKFIIRGYRMWKDVIGCRTMMDSMMNAPFLYWAAKESGDEKYYEAAHTQAITTEKLLLRNDASSFHHYQFDPETAKPVKGLTLQGFSDDSCWGRGHSWGIYGYPIAYSYTNDKKFIDILRDITYYMLNRLPDDAIPYWDYIFTQGSDEPRDSSCAVISACGLDEMCRHLPDDSYEKTIFKNAAAQMLEAVIDKCTLEEDVDYDGLINHVTHALPQKAGIDECAVYGDYFYLEALMRYLNPEWKMYW